MVVGFVVLDFACGSSSLGLFVIAFVTVLVVVVVFVVVLVVARVCV